MAEVTVMHSVMTRATGSMAMVMGAWRVRGAWWVFAAATAARAGESVVRMAMVSYII